MISFSTEGKVEKGIIIILFVFFCKYQNSTEKDKRNIKLVVILESPEFLKGPILIAIGFNSLMTLVK